MIELKGLSGESLVFDGATVAKFRHNGLDEAARNPVSSYRQVQIKHRPGKQGNPGRYEVMVVLASFMSIAVAEPDKPGLDAFIAAVETAKRPE